MNSRIILTALILFSFGTQLSRAIPAFARKYRISCKTCHAPSVPKLKDYGNDYAGDGFKLQDYESPGYFVDAGDEKLSLIRNFPLAVRMDGYITCNFSGNGRHDLSAPYLLKLLSGGELSDHLAYYFYFYMDEQGEIAGVEDAYLMYDNFLNSPLDIYLGQFQVSDPLFKRELRLSLEDYHVYTSRIGLSDINMKYDKGIMLTCGFDTGTDLIVEVVNGNGLSEADPWNLFDKDKYKNFLGRVSQDLGSILRLGVVGYFGKEKITNNIGNSLINQVAFYGPDATVTVSNLFEFNVQYLARQDDQVLTNPETAEIQEDINTKCTLAELIFTPKGDDSDWYAMGLLNWIDSDYRPAGYRSATLHAGYLPRRNVRLSAEYSYVFSEQVDDFGKFSLGFTSAF